MRKRFAFAAVWASCWCIPAFCGNPLFDDAVAKGARLAGPWVATLDLAQSAMFSDDPSSRVIMNVQLRISRNDNLVETLIMGARLELEQNFQGSPAYKRIQLSGFTLPAEEGLQLSSPKDIATGTDEIRMRATLGDVPSKMTALISRGAQSAWIVFARPTLNPDAPVQGDWLNESGITGGAIVHVYPMGPSHVAGTLDRIYGDRADLGMPMSDFGKISPESVSLWLESPASTLSFDAVLESPDMLKVQWRGSGFLSEPNFRRIAAESYVPQAPAIDVISKP